MNSAAGNGPRRGGTPGRPPATAAGVGRWTAASLVIANMIGTGVFTSLGFQAAATPAVFPVMLLWVVGGVCALCGALSYGELAAALPRSGGEFNFLSRIYHPAVGFIAGWTSITVGFAAPIALAAMALGKYGATAVPILDPLAVSCIAVLAITLAHLLDLRASSLFQNVFTTAKIALLLAVVVAGATLGSRRQPVSFLPGPGDWSLVLSPPFAVSLVYVMYAYSGWNASTYIAGEIRDPGRALPWSLWVGTLAVTGLYVAVNATFLLAAPLPALAGHLEVAAIAAQGLFGATGGRLMSGLIGLGLVSCISAMTWAGPRIAQVMGEDFAPLRFLARRSRTGLPAVAILFQTAIVLALLLTATFEGVLIYTQFTLNLCAVLTVAGVFVLRRREPHLPRPYRTWGYPVTPALFLLIAFAMLLFVLVTRPTESIAGILTATFGLIFYRPRRPTIPPTIAGDQSPP